MVGIAGIMAGGVLQAEPQSLTQATTNSATPPASFWGGLKMAEQAIADSTNWDAGFGGGRSLNTSGAPITIGFANVVYDFAPQIGGTGFSAGLIVGYDVLHRGSLNLFNSVSGGLQLENTISPLAFLGSPALDKVKCTLSVAQLIATPRAGNAIGSVTVTSASFDVHDFGRFALIASGHYEVRAGQGSFSGHFAMASLFLQRNF